MSPFRLFRFLAASFIIGTLALAPMAVAAAPAAISARATDFGDGNFSITISWDSGSDNGNPVVWVCESYNGNAPISFDTGTSGSQIANFIPKGTYTFGLYTSMECTTLVDNATVTVRHG
jgi:hypothetical protein